MLKITSVILIGFLFAGCMSQVEESKAQRAAFESQDLKNYRYTVVNEAVSIDIHSNPSSSKSIQTTTIIIKNGIPQSRTSITKRDAFSQHNPDTTSYITETVVNDRVLVTEHMTFDSSGQIIQQTTVENEIENSSFTQYKIDSIFDYIDDYLPVIAFTGPLAGKMVIKYDPDFHYPYYIYPVINNTVSITSCELLLTLDCSRPRAERVDITKHITDFEILAEE